MQEKTNISDGLLLRIRLKARRAAIFGDNDSLNVFQRLCGTTNMLEMVRMLRCMIVMDALERNGYNARKAARDIHVDTSSIYEVCNLLGIDAMKEKQKIKENKRKKRTNNNK